MDADDADQSQLLIREMTMWREEGGRTRNKLDDLRHDDPDAAIEQAWGEYCHQKYQAVARHLDATAAPQRAHVNLDDLDRQPEE